MGGFFHEEMAFLKEEKAPSEQTFGQAFGPGLGGLIYKQLGAANHMLSTGVALAVISSVCLMFIGDGCFSWMREACCYSQQGYSQVAGL